MTDITDLDDAIDEQGDLVRELRRTVGCEIRAQEAENVLHWLESVQQKAIKYKEIRELLNTQ